MAIRRTSLYGAIVPVGGPAGLPGQSAYQAWLALGNTGALADYVAAQKGQTGPAGATGAQGPAGATGAQGPAGATGATGAQGVQGTQGVQGPKPWSAPVAWAASTVYTATAPASAVTYGGGSYVCATSHTSGATFDATKWTQIAAQGATGPQGAQGIQGSKGDTGATGAQGPSGPAGATGATGAQGVQGSQGPTGATGAQGVQGAQGNPTTVNGKSGQSITLAASDVGAAASGANGDITSLTALRGVGAPAFGGIPTRIVIGNNPDGQVGFSDTKTKNPQTILVDVGGYGAPTFSGLAIPEAIAGAISIPSSATAANHASALAGYAKSASTATGAVGIYGQGDVVATNALAWGFNTRSQDNGFKTVALWGGEIDVNVAATGTFARGLDIVGGSTATPDAASPALIIQAIGVFQSPKIPWGRGVLINDAAALTGIEIGTATESANSGSMPISMFYRTAQNVRAEVFRIQAATGGDIAIQVQKTSGLLKILGNNGGTATTNVTVYGGNTGIGDGAPLPSYPLDVYGAARFTGNIGFNGVAPVGRQSVPAQATDAATTQALANYLRLALINFGLAQ